MFYYGTQYYRYPNPPALFWEEDFQKMKDCGFNVVKLWVLWNTVNHREGVCDFTDLENLADLAAQNGIQVILNTIIENAPYWLIHKYPEAMHTSALGYKAKPQSRGNTPTGGWPGLCLHNEPVREAAFRFFEETAKRFKGLNNLYAYDIWNETFYEAPVFFAPEIVTGMYCYCKATQSKFKEWLRRKYQSIAGLNEAWFRRYSDWNEVYPPLQRGGYPDMLDWLTFRTEDFTSQLQWRYEIFRSIDPEVKLISHVGVWGDQSQNLTDTNSLAKLVDEWGVSSFNDIYNRAGDVTEHMLYRLDQTRSDAAGKRFWQSELKGGQNTGGNAHCSLKRSPMAREVTMRAWNWCALLVGAKGLMYWQYRPEYLGPETPGNGLTDLAGRETERLRQAAWFARFTNQHEFIAHSRPLPGEVGILKLPEAERFSYLLDANTPWFDQAVEGAYQGFATANCGADPVTIDRIYEYELVYLPFSQMIERTNIVKLKEYVRSGGKLVAEACTAHYQDRSYCSFEVPGGMTDLFGAEQLMADSLFDLEIKPVLRLRNGLTIETSIYQEWFTPLGGRIFGTYEDGSAAVVENNYGQGKTLLIGTYPSIGQYQQTNQAHQDFFKFLLEWAGQVVNVSTGDPDVHARLHTWNGRYYLYVVNLKNHPKEAELVINSELGLFNKGQSTVKQVSILIINNNFRLHLGNCEGDIIQLDY